MFNCKICGKNEENKWNKQLAEKLQTHKLCFYCNFWDEKCQWKKNKDPNAVRIKGRHFYIREEKFTSHIFRGYGGSKFTISFKDGRKIVTTNLWSQGEIPEIWRDKLPDNAEFVNE